MKHFVAALFFTLVSVNAFAGACQTNATSFRRNLETSCGTLTGAPRTECAQRVFDSLSASIRRICPELEAIKRSF